MAERAERIRTETSNFNQYRSGIRDRDRFVFRGTNNHPLGYDELSVAGALRNEPVELCKCLTVNEMAIANAEICQSKGK